MSTADVLYIDCSKIRRLHNWQEEYYGWRCATCRQFIPFGCEPWMPLEETDAADQAGDIA